jgi:hypothetical protein
MSGFQSNKHLGASPTTAAPSDKSDRAIIHQAGHQSSRVLERHIRAEAVFRENAAAHVGYPWGW